MAQQRIWATWLPPDVAAGACNEEPKRFAALSRCVCAEVQRAADNPQDPDRWFNLIRWLPHINR